MTKAYCTSCFTGKVSQLPMDLQKPWNLSPWTICNIRYVQYKWLDKWHTINREIFIWNHLCVKYSYQLIFMGLWYPQKYFNMNIYILQQTFITVVLLILPMSLFSYHYLYYIVICRSLPLYCSNYAVVHSSILWVLCEVTSLLKRA